MEIGGSHLRAAAFRPAQLEVHGCVLAASVEEEFDGLDLSPRPRSSGRRETFRRQRDGAALDLLATRDRGPRGRNEVRGAGLEVTARLVVLREWEVELDEAPARKDESMAIDPPLVSSPACRCARSRAR